MREQRIPKLESEADEAWWYAHRQETARWMEEAAANGQTTTLSEVLQRACQRGGNDTDGIDPDRSRRYRPRA
jgi:hypothetical protein